MGNVLSEEEPSSKSYHHQEQSSTQVKKKTLQKLNFNHCNTYNSPFPQHDVDHKDTKVESFPKHPKYSSSRHRLEDTDSIVLALTTSGDDDDDDEEINGITHNNPCDLKVGCRLSVYWPGDDEYYNCVIASKQGTTTYQLFYDDDDTEILDLQHEKYKLLSWPENQNSTIKKRKIIQDSDEENDDDDDEQNNFKIKTEKNYDKRKATKKKTIRRRHIIEDSDEDNQEEECPDTDVDADEEQNKHKLNTMDGTQRNKNKNKRKVSKDIMNQYDKSWCGYYQELLEFKKYYGHCNVPCKYEANKQLGRWVDRQRQMYKHTKKGCNISEERIELLEKIGFEWDRKRRIAIKSTHYDKLWCGYYQELLEFKKYYGHCNVPCKYEANKQLGRWVDRQRQMYKHTKKGCNISEERIELLEKIGFEWDRKRRIAITSTDK